MAGEQILQQRRAAAVGNGLERRAGRLLEQDPGDIGRAAYPDRAVVGFAVALFEPGDEALEVVGRQRLVGDDPDRRVGDQRDRREIVYHVVGEIHRRGVEHVGLHVADADRVSVGRRLRNTADADAAAGAGDVLDDQRLAEAHLHPFGQDARERVGRPAGRIRHHERDRARRIDLRVSGAHADEAENREQE